ncbi:MAG: 23S rRNA (uracil(1939)-C(5))-methyltransferase RlmD [Prevotella sp.]|nr:23S rRNA (uracil(1939)-C(5))-methyltransferase RlmD [Prevotella sp.]
MSRRRKPLPLLEGVRIESVAAEGKALARVDEQVVFVPFAVPGDVVDLQVTKKKHKYCEARVVRFVEKSPVRTEPRCQHFGLCGGCKWQQLPYEEQLRAKQRQVYDQLSRIGKVELPEFRPILGSRQIYEYRNKLEFGFSNKRWLTPDEIQSLPPGATGKPRTAAEEAPTAPDGAPAAGEQAATDGQATPLVEMNAVGFHITGAFDKILPIEKCHLMDDLHNRIRNTIRDYALANGLRFFDLRQQTGLLRDMMLRNSNTGEWMLLLQFHYDRTSPSALKADEEASLALMEHVADRFPEITSLMFVDNQKCNDTFGDLELQLFRGRDHIFELMEDLRFKVGPKSFYQTNTEQALHLYTVARELAGLTGDELVYDLYTGTGTIANFVARHARQVIGIEYVPEAIEDAKVNSLINGIGNTLFFAGDMKDILTDEFVARYGRPDVVITDPPRAGMHADVVEVILRARPRRIVYVSCNPATQARDLSLLDQAYRVSAVQPVDMFPHTPHVENVVALDER